MNPCKECIVDVICIKECPMFEIDLERLQSDNFLYLKRCFNNSKKEISYKISKNIEVIISVYFIEWYKDGKWHRDNDQPAIIYSDGSRYWFKNGKRHRDNNKPAITNVDREQYWYKNGVEYEPM